MRAPTRSVSKGFLSLDGDQALQEEYGEVPPSGGISAAPSASVREWHQTFVSVTGAKICVVKCMFCHRDDQRTSREHIISEPIAALMGVDRQRDLLAAVDGEGETRIPAVPFVAHSVRGPCEDCNSGWMQQVDTAAAETIKAHTESPGTVSAAELGVIQAWLIKTYYVFGLRDDKFQNPIEGEDLVSHLVPDPTQAKALHEGDHERAVGHSIVGVGRVQGDWPVTGFGNCRTNPRQLLIFAGVLILGLPAVDAQFWLANPTLPAKGVRFPPGVKRAAVGMLWRNRGRGAFPSPNAVIVDFLAG